MIGARFPSNEKGYEGSRFNPQVSKERFRADHEALWTLHFCKVTSAGWLEHSDGIKRDFFYVGG